MNAFLTRQFNRKIIFNNADVVDKLVLKRMILKIIFLAIFESISKF